MLLLLLPLVSLCHPFPPKIKPPHSRKVFGHISLPFSLAIFFCHIYFYFVCSPLLPDVVFSRSIRYLNHIQLWKGFIFSKKTENIWLSMDTAKKKEKQNNINKIFIGVASPQFFSSSSFLVRSIDGKFKFSNVSLYTVELRKLKGRKKLPVLNLLFTLSSSYIATIFFSPPLHHLPVLRRRKKQKQKQLSSTLLSLLKKTNVLNVLPSATCMFLFTHDLLLYYHESLLFFISYKMASIILKKEKNKEK